MERVAVPVSAPRAAALWVGRLPLALFAAACLWPGVTGCAGSDDAAGASSGAGPDAAAGVVFRDSAGVTIVENPVRAPDSTDWWIDTIPVLVLGGADAVDEPYLFSWINDVAWLSDGSLVVADHRMRAVRVFDAAGGFLRRLGGEGDGPGEFNGVRAVEVLPGDTVLVVNAYLGQPSLFFGPDGTFLRNWRPPSEVPPAGTDGVYGEPSLGGVFADGSTLVVASFGTARRTDISPHTPTLQRDYHRLLRADPGGNIVADYGEQLAGQTFQYVGGDPRLPGFRLSSWLPQPSRAIVGDALFLTDGAAFEIRVYDVDGQLARIIRKRHDPAPLTHAWADSVWDAMTATLPPEIAWLTGAPMPPLPDAAPVIELMTADPLGNLWVRSHPPGRAAPPAWYVFDADGVLRHSLSSELRPLAVGSDRVAVVTRDEYDVPILELYPIRRR